MVARFGTKARRKTVCTAEALPIYHLPAPVVMRLVWAALTRTSHSFAQDAQAVVRRMPAAIEVMGASHIPVTEACLVVCNHYTRPGLDAWWFAVTITAAIAAHRLGPASAPSDVHWIVTEAWRYPTGDWRRQVVTPLTRWAFTRVARVYDFVPMPPMPPVPDEVTARAVAVRRAVRLARRLAREGGLLGLAPEGRDVPGSFGETPVGAGDFIALLVAAGLRVLPVGVAEPEGRLRLSFGPAFVPEIPQRREERDRKVIAQVMTAIAHQLPNG